jgi:signal peptidase I
MFSYKVLRKAFKKGDVVISHCPYDIDKTVCKRIAAVEGETVIFGGQDIVVPRGHVWLLGDNINNSTDSRRYGAVSTQLIIGRVALKIFPTLFKPFEIVSSNFRPQELSTSSIISVKGHSTPSEKVDEQDDTSDSTTISSKEKSSVDQKKDTSSANDDS